MSYVLLLLEVKQYLVNVKAKLGLIGTTTPPSQSQTYPLAAQQQHWPWALRGTSKANPRTRPRWEVRLLLLRRVSTASLER